MNKEATILVKSENPNHPPESYIPVYTVTTEAGEVFYLHLQVLTQFGSFINYSLLTFFRQLQWENVSKSVCYFPTDLPAGYYVKYIKIAHETIAEPTDEIDLALNMIFKPGITTQPLIAQFPDAPSINRETFTLGGRIPYEIVDDKPTLIKLFQMIRVSNEEKKVFDIEALNIVLRVYEQYGKETLIKLSSKYKSAPEVLAAYHEAGENIELFIR